MSPQNPPHRPPAFAEPTVRLQVTVPVRTRDKLRELASDADITVAQVIARLTAPAQVTHVNFDPLKPPPIHYGHLGH